MIYPLIKSVLFKLDPEKAHHLVLNLAELGPILGQLSGVKSTPELEVNVGTLKWRSPIGLAAGLDKNAQALGFFSAQGFGSAEVGTITLHPQLGNPTPRVFRYPEEESLRNSMGFPSEGMLTVMKRLQHYCGPLIIGANLGKNKESSPEESIEELHLMTETLKDHINYFVVNVSSPNTPGLRALQESSYLKELFLALNREKDIYLKISPDLEKSKIEELLKLCANCSITGIIATNTTIMPERGIGGISGKLLKLKAKEIRDFILERDYPLELIGVGGFSQFSDVLDFWNAGGKAFQVYTSYVYQGPDLLHHFNQEMLNFLKVHQLKNLNEYFKLSKNQRAKLARVMISS
jgi:dihydroorotate dehydrogenase